MELEEVDKEDNGEEENQGSGNEENIEEEGQGDED